MPGQILDLAPHAYDVQLSEADWGGRILETLAAVFGGRSMAMFRVASSNEVTAVRRIGPDALWSSASVAHIVENAGFCLARTMGLSFTTLSGMSAGMRGVPGWNDCWGESITDALGLISRDARGDVFAAAVGLESVRPTAKAEQALLSKLALHLGTADRMRREASPLERAEAIVDARGALAHANDPRPEIRERLADGLARRQFAQRNRDAPATALAVWEGLVAGRWSLVDFFDTDGKRFVLALKNAPVVPQRADLTPRERRVAAPVAMGHRDKEIAYMLGLSLAAVSTAVRRARLKLGATTRAGLVNAWKVRGSLARR